MDTGTLVALHYGALIRRTVLAPESVLAQIGLVDPSGFLGAVQRSPSLAFRVAMLGLWQEEWL